MTDGKIPDGLLGIDNSALVKGTSSIGGFGFYTPNNTGGQITDYKMSPSIPFPQISIEDIEVAIAVSKNTDNDEETKKILEGLLAQISQQVGSNDIEQVELLLRIYKKCTQEQYHFRQAIHDMLTGTWYNKMRGYERDMFKVQKPTIHYTSPAPIGPIGVGYGNGTVPIMCASEPQANLTTTTGAVNERNKEND